MENNLFYLDCLKADTSSYELKSFRIQHDESQLTRYLVKYARKHEEECMNKTYLVRNKSTGCIFAWFSLKAATLPFNQKDEIFLTPAIELTHFAVDERYKVPENVTDVMKTGEFIFWNFILPIVKEVAEKIACKDLFLFAINTPKLVDYYTQCLGFKEIENIDDKQFFEYEKPDYDSGCKFLYFPLGE